MTGELSAAETLYGRPSHGGTSSLSTDDDWHFERGLRFVSNGVKQALAIGRDKGWPTADTTWRADVEKAGGALAYFGKENAAALRTFANAISRSASDEPSPEHAYPRGSNSKGDVHLAGIIEDLMFFGGGKPKLVPSPKGATQFIFPSGMVLRFDIKPGQYRPGTGTKDGPHINLQWPGIYNEHIKLLP